MSKTIMPVPTEAEEQKVVIQYLDLHGYKYTSIPNSTYTTSIKQKINNKNMGLRAGFPDLVTIVDGQFIAIEMKRQKGGVVSQAQKDWIEALNNAGVPAIVARGAQEAIEFIDSWRTKVKLKGEPKEIF